MGKKVPTNLQILMNSRSRATTGSCCRVRQRSCDVWCHSGARRKARARNPFIHDLCGPMDSGFARSLSSGRALRGPGGAAPE